MALERQVYDKFNRGEFGVVAPSKAQDGTFTGVNVLNYASGLLGPRAGLVATGWTIGAGTLTGFGQHSPDSAYDYWAQSGSACYLMTDDSSTVTTATGGFSAPPTAPVQGVAVGTTLYLSSYNDKLYQVAGTTLSSVASSPGGKSMVMFGARLLMANTGTSTKNRVRFSDANVFTTWGALSYFDVGNDGAITGMWVVRNQVWIAKDNGEWWVYTGVPGETDSLKLAQTGVNVPADFRAGTVSGLQTWYVVVDDHFPSYFNGNIVIQVSELNLAGTLYGTPTGLEPGVSVTNLPRENDVVIMAGSTVAGDVRRCLVQKDGAWTRHDPVASWAVPRAGTNGQVVVSDGGGTAGNARFWYWKVTAPDSPPTDADELTDDGTEFTCQFMLPEHSLKDGADFRVNQVIVDYLRYNPDTDDPNEIAVEVEATHQWNNAIPSTSIRQASQDLPSDEGVNGEPRRLRLAVGDQGYGGGCRTTISGIRGVAIESVVIEYEKTKARA